MKPIEAMEGLVKQMTKTASNAEFLAKIGLAQKDR